MLGLAAIGRQDLEDLLHQRTAADQVADLEAPLEFLAQRLDLAEIAEGLHARR